MSEKGGKEEEIKKFLTEIIEPVVKESYGMGIKDILDRINTINRELGEISKAISRLENSYRVLENNFGRIDERTKIMLNIEYALIGGVFGTLVGIILMLVQLIAH